MFALYSTGFFDRIHLNNLGNEVPMEYLRSDDVTNFRQEKLSVAHFCGRFYDFARSGGISFNPWNLD